MSRIIFVDDVVNAVDRIQDAADRSVVVQGIDHERDIFAHITVNIIRTFKQLRSLIDQVGGQDGVEAAFFICLIEFFQSVCE